MAHLKILLTRCAETSVNNYQSKLLGVAKERRCQLTSVKSISVVPLKFQYFSNPIRWHIEVHVLSLEKIKNSIASKIGRLTGDGTWIFVLRNPHISTRL